MRLLLLPLAALVTLAGVGRAAETGNSTGVWPQSPAVVDAYVALALQHNLALQIQTLDVDGARVRLSQVRGALQPQVDFVARYSAATGGRQIDFPIGDIINPVYKTLNDFLVAQGKPGPFPQIGNQSINFYRDHEQETKLRLLAPLYRPEIHRGIEANRAAVASREAALAAFRRELRLTVITAYHRWLQADAAAAILESASKLTAEALRVNQLLLENDKTTEDRVLRAKADNLEVKQQQVEINRDRNVARAYLNFLLNRPLETPIDKVADASLQSTETALLAANPAENASPAHREELTALEKGVDAASAAEAAVRAKLRPTLGLAVEAGIQGEGYRLDHKAPYTLASLVAEYNVWDGQRNKGQLSQAVIERRKLEYQRDEARAQMSLQIQQAADDFRAAAAASDTARQRELAAQGAFSVVTAREREGLANQLIFLDARNELTRAELNRQITRQRLFIAAAAYERAAALTPAP